LRKSFTILSLSVVLLLLRWDLAQAEWFSDEQEKMGTRVEVQLWSDDRAVAEELIAQAMAELDRIEALMSTYMDTSEMSRVNASAYAQPQKVTAELFGLLKIAMEISVATDGAFDISYDSVGQLYDFRAGKHPDENQIAAQLENIDYHHVILDEAAQTVSFKTPGVRINLGGIAKGYSVERVIRLLREAGVEHALATAGGDTRILGDRRGKPWIVGVRDPNQRDGIFTRIPLDDEAISTSGDYERFFIEDGKRYHHIIRPTDGRPVEGVRSVSVIGPDGTVTDGLSTGLFVLGPEAGLEVLKRFPGYEALFVTNDNFYYSEGLSPE
jgi:thiamine biosynthesis lipoprotein